MKVRIVAGSNGLLWCQYRSMFMWWYFGSPLAPQPLFHELGACKAWLDRQMQPAKVVYEATYRAALCK
jgi:hypothetical protein